MHITKYYAHQYMQIISMYLYIYMYVEMSQIIYRVGGLEHLLCFHILGIIIPTDFHIFQRG